MLQVTLPEELEQWAVENAVPEGFGTPEALVVAAVRDLRARQEAGRRDAASVLEAIEEEGDDIQATPEWWDGFRVEMSAKYGSK